MGACKTSFLFPLRQIMDLFVVGGGKGRRRINLPLKILSSALFFASVSWWLCSSVESDLCFKNRSVNANLKFLTSLSNSVGVFGLQEPSKPSKMHQKLRYFYRQMLKASYKIKTHLALTIFWKVFQDCSMYSIL